MKSQDYWQKRFTAIEAQNNKTARSTVHSVTTAFDKAQAQIEKELNAWYARFADNNQITLQEAKRLLNTRELKEFRWDVEKYIEMGQQNALDQKWLKELENASARVHISRLEALRIRTQQAAELAFGNELDALDQMAARMYTDDYYHTAYEIQRGLGVGWDIGQIDQRRLDNVLSKPWTADKLTFSDRIWKSKTQLLDSLQTEFTQMCILGKAPDETIKLISHKMNVSKGQAGRLIMTEAAYFSSAAQKDCFNDLDVEKFEVVATLDRRTSETCQHMDGQVFDMKDFQIGVTAPPFHVWCRTCTAPWFEDNDDGTRAARGEDGKTYQVPASMKYQDWKDHFVDKIKDPDKWLKPATVSDIVEAAKEVKEIRKAIKLEPDMFPRSFTRTKPEATNTQMLVDFINNCEDADPTVVELYSKMDKMESIVSQGIPFDVKHTKNSAVNYRYYTTTGKLSEASISYPKLTLADPTGQVNTTLHEQMHLMDMYLRKDPLKATGWYSSEQGELVEFFKNLDTNNIKMSKKVEKLFEDFKTERKKFLDELVQTHNAQYKGVYELYRESKIDFKEYKKRTKALDKVYEDQWEWGSRNAFGGGIDCLQDIYDAMSGGTFREQGVVMYGHGKKYYQSIDQRCHETLANYGALKITRPELIDFLREDYPELVEMMEQTIEGMLKKVGN